MGKGGAGGHTPTESSDTLRAKQVVRVLLAVSEGEIEGIEEIYLNQIPIGNFEDVTWEWRAGTMDQEPIAGFTETEAPLPGFDSVQIERGTKQTQENEPQGFTPNEYFASIPWDVNAARLTFSVQALFFVTDLGDKQGYQVGYDIYTRPSSGSNWTLAHSGTKKGKASSVYAWDVRINRPVGVTDASNWDIKVIRRTRDDPESRYMSVSFWSGVTQIYDISLSYPGTALVGIICKNAEEFGGQIPEILIKGKGRKVKIPSNYNPTTRAYDETPPWDGSFNELTYYYTPNPAWILFDVLNSSKGLGISQSSIDIYSLYSLSKFSDQLVDDGYGTKIRRYEIHNQYYTRENAPTFLTYILNICNANLTTNEFGQISVIFDHQDQAVTKQVTNANIIDGIFNYSSNALEERFSLVNVTYNNELYYGRTDTATVEEEDLVTRYGLQSTDLVLPGCKSQAQAIRKARAVLYTSARTTGMVTFSVLFEGLVYQVGEIVRVLDNHNQDVVQAGRVLSVTHNASTTTVVLDRNIEASSGVYTFSSFEPDGFTEITKAVNVTNGANSVSLSGVINIAANAVFILSGEVKAALFKVVKIVMEDNVYTITAVEHDERKYEYIDSGILPFDDGDGDFTNDDDYNIPAVTNIQVEESFGSNGVVSNGILTVTWDWDIGNAKKYKPNYKIAWTRDDGQTSYGKDFSTKSYDIPNPVPGIYEITVWAVHPFTGFTSPPTGYVYYFRVEAGGSTLYPPINIHCLGRTDTIFNTPDMNLGWEYNPINATVSDALFDYVVEVWNSSGITKYKTYVVNPDTSKNGTFKFSFFENADVFGSPTRTFNVKIYSRDTLGDLSDPAVVQVTNPPPALTNWEVTPDFNGVNIRITPSKELDIKEYIIYKGSAAGFEKNDASIAYAGPDTAPFIYMETGILQYFALGIADTFGRDGINISTEQSELALSVEIDTFVYTGLLFKPNDPVTNSITWTEGTATRNGTDTWTIAANTTGAAWTTGIMYIYYVPGTTELAWSTSLVNAIAAHGRVLATYKGGTDVTADSGKAFIDGDQILAGSIGAAQLVADQAIITSGLQIGNVIESSTWNPTTKHGWKIDKTGNIISYGSFELREAGTGDAIMISGAIDWNKITGTDIPSPNADVTSDYIGGRGVNILNSYYSFYPAGLPDMHHNSTATISLDLATTYFGVSSLKVVASGADAYVYLGASSENNFKLTPNKKWTLSFYVRCSNAGKSLNMYLFTDFYYGATKTIATANIWERVSHTFNLEADNATAATIRVDNEGGSGVTMWFDGFMLEEVVGNTGEPSAYSVPGSTGALSQIDQITLGNISTYIASASIGTLFIANDAITANTVYTTGGPVTLGTPGSTPNGSTGTQIFSAAELIIPSVNVATKRVAIVTVLLGHYDTTPGSIKISLGGEISPLTFDPTNQALYGSSLSRNTFTAQFTFDVSANATTLPFPLTIILENGPSGTTPLHYWNAATAPGVSVTITIITGKR